MHPPRSPSLPSSPLHRVLLAVALAVATLPGGLPATAHAEEVVLFRCTDGNGALTVQNAPCPAGTSQRIRRFAAPTAAGAPLATPAAPAPGVTASSAPPPAPPAASSGAPAPAGGAMLQPALLPVLQGGVQTSVEAEGTEILDSDVLRQQARAAAEAAAGTTAAAKAPLPEIYQCEGSEGNRYLHEREPAPPHCVLMTVTGLGGNTPVNAAGCEVVRDACEAIVETQRCNSWQQRFRDARGSERFAAPENKPALAAERARLQAILASSNCPIP